MYQISKESKMTSALWYVVSYTGMYCINTHTCIEVNGATQNMNENKFWKFCIFFLFYLGFFFLSHKINCDFSSQSKRPEKEEIYDVV